MYLYHNKTFLTAIIDKKLEGKSAAIFHTFVPSSRIHIAVRMFLIYAKSFEKH